MSKLKLIYFNGCPNAEKTQNLLSSITQDFEIVVQDDLSGDHPYKSFSSPTLLKDEEVIFGSESSNEGGCSLSIPTSDELKGLLSE